MVCVHKNNIVKPVGIILNDFLTCEKLVYFLDLQD